MYTMKNNPGGTEFFCKGKHVNPSAIIDVLNNRAGGKETQWKKLGETPIQGVYWVAGVYPETDCDANERGETVGWYTGKEMKFVALVEIDYDSSKGIFEAFPVNEHVTGKFQQEDFVITHYKEFVSPEHPKM